MCNIRRILLRREARVESSALTLLTTYRESLAMYGVTMRGNVTSVDPP